ncbi:replication-associated recombination protein A [Desulforegula conservatrix]|uniref:replication-associated recombination protein A n=1 Tax=Desulforegula conservatrix TaxID=153026 RepID=UPI0004048771|nr:replication-associated recombination protein A [Desulforegula conservatrix]
MKPDSSDLFDVKKNRGETYAPLAERMRPASLDEFSGQEQVVADGSIIRLSIENDQLFSMILWGPPGCGKTTLARIVAKKTKSRFIQISAVLSGVKDVRQIIDEANEARRTSGKRTILFVDEIHRFNKSQQDAFLPHVESGLLTLIGATTENPSFEIIPALLSRCRIVVMESLSDGSIIKILKRALEDSSNGLASSGTSFTDSAIAYIASISGGDARFALGSLEATASYVSSLENEDKIATEEIVKTALSRKSSFYDKSGEQHYNIISAFHKSLRGSDPDAALYWLARMLGSGEDPFYIARRMVRFASEDIGMADSSALQVALNAVETFKFLGHPEGDLALAHAAVYLATAPKSNSLYMAFKKVAAEAEETGYLPVPMHIRNAPTSMMKGLGYGKDYKYAHDFKDGYASQEYMPKGLEGKRYYIPTERGYEKLVKQRLEGWLAIKAKSKKGESS